MTRLRAWAIGASNSALCFARQWWRPLICLSIGGSVLVNGIVVPILTRTFPDLTGLAAVIAAASPFAYFRSSEKKAGVA